MCVHVHAAQSWHRWFGFYPRLDRGVGYIAILSPNNNNQECCGDQAGDGSSSVITSSAMHDVVEFGHAIWAEVENALHKYRAMNCSNAGIFP
eukprot:3967654-Pyramimonas_sp.AAC.2